MQIDVRIKLDRLRVVRQNESSDEPFLWVLYFKFDGSTANILLPDQATIGVRAPSGAHHNLGKPSEGVGSGQSIPIPAAIGEWETSLRGFDGALELTQFATLSLAVAGLEEDQTTDTHALEAHRRVVADVKQRLTAEIRRVIRDIVAARAAGEAGPSAQDVEERLRDQVNADRIREVIDGLISDVLPFAIVGAFFNPVSLISAAVEGSDPDDRVGYAVPDPFTFPRILANSLLGIPLVLELTKDQSFLESMKQRFPQITFPPEVKDRILRSEDGSYRVTGRVERRDIQEPPTFSGLWRAKGRLAICARSSGSGVYLQRSSDGGTTWGFNKRVGSGVVSSGPAAAWTADGARVSIAGRGKDHRIWFCISDPDGKPLDDWDPIQKAEFRTGPGLACSADGKHLWLAATAEDGRVLITRNAEGGRNWTDKWDPLSDETFLTSPALACSADGSKAHFVALDASRRIRHAFTPDRGRTWDPPFTRRLGKTFLSAPSCACSADGSLLWVAALGDDHKYLIRRLAKFGADASADWLPFGGSFVSAPALACSADGAEVHVFGIARDLTIRHRFSTDAGKNWTKWERAAGGAWF